MAKPKKSSSSAKPTDSTGASGAKATQKPEADSKAATFKTTAKKPGAASKAAATKADPVEVKAEAAKTSMPKVAKADATVAAKDNNSDAPAVDKKPVSEEAKKTDASGPEKGGSDARPQDAKAAHTPAPLPAPVPQPEPRRSIFLPLVLGGVVAAGIGFAASEFDLLNLRGGDPDVQALLTAQQQSVAANEARLSALENSNADVPAAPEVDLSGIEEQLSGLSEQMTVLQSRIDALENRPVVASVDTTAAQEYADELARLQTSVEDQKAEIRTLLDNARSVEEATADMAQDAEQTAALTAITAALTSGAPYSDALADLQAAGVTDIPEGLSAAADGGVATLSNLQTGFANGARSALAAARAAGAQEGEDGLGGFLRRQLGARSVAPRDGADPDAVLSRAEAAVRDGALDTALTEIDTLPQDVQAGLEPWLSDARTRAAAEAAIADILQRQTTN